MTPKTTTLALLLLAVGLRPATAQARHLEFPSVGANVAGDHVRLTGPGYTARLDGAGLEYVPLLGPRAPRDLPLRAQPISIRRGDNLVWTRGDAAPVPQVDGMTATCRLGDGVTAVHQARADGVEQSFVLAARPAGDGDLVVRLAITTALRLAAADAEAGLRFEAEGIGGVTIGGVTGVDACGERVRGVIRMAADDVEYVLPTAFVDRARYPLTVDPLFGSAFFVGNAAAGTDDAPDVAFDATTLRSLVVWRVATSAVQGEVRAQLVSFTGVPVGGNIVLDASASATHRPRVANVNASDNFAVAYVHRSVSGPFAFYTLQVRTVDAATGVASLALSILPASPDDFVLAGDSRFGLFGSNQNVLLAYITGGQVKTVLVDAPPSLGPPTVASSTLILPAGPQPSQLAVTRHGGPFGRWLVAWVRASLGGPGIEMITVDDSNGLASNPASMGVDVQMPAVATRDGTSFALAYRDNPTSRVRIRTVSNATTTLMLGPTLDPAQASGITTTPAIDFATDKYVLAWRQSNLISPAHIRVKSLDPSTCAVCSSEHFVESSATAQNDPAVGAWFSGDNSMTDTALVVWEDAGVIRARRYEATGSGGYAGLGGACGSGGGIVGHDGSPVLGDSTFALTLSSAAAPVLGVIIGFSAVSTPCGPCTLVPALDVVLTGPGPHPIPVPCDPGALGLQFWSQWMMLSPGGCSIVPFLGLSPARLYTIGE